MTILSKYFSQFDLPKSFDAPQAAYFILEDAWYCRYPELGEVRTQPDLWRSLTIVLSILGTPDRDDLAHRRHVHLALTIARAARIAIGIYFPEDERPDTVIQAVSAWLNQGTPSPLNLKDQLFAHMPEYADGDDAYSILYDLLRALEKKDAHGSILNILDNALTGSAITVYTEDRRKVLNWLLIDAIPAAYSLSSPQYLVTRKGVVELAP